MEVYAAVSRSVGTEFIIEKLTLGNPRSDEVLVRIAGVGICHTDLLARDGIIPIARPAVFGHEGAGTVLAIGDKVTRVKPGDKVVLTFGFCGSCAPCQSGEPAYCASSAAINLSGGRLDGSKSLQSDVEEVSSHFVGQSSFADTALAYEQNTILIPDDVPVEIMGPLGCGVQTGAGAIINTLRCEPGKSLLVTGGGSVGLSAVLAAIVQGCSPIIVVEPHDARRALALELGATHAIDPRTADTATAVREIVPTGVDYAFDSTANSAVIGTAASALAMRGRLALAGVPSDPAAMISLPVLPMVAMGQSVIGVVEGDSNPSILIPYLISLYQAGRFPLDRLITTYFLSDINQAVADQHEGRCVKAVLIPDGDRRKMLSPIRVKH